MNDLALITPETLPGQLSVAEIDATMAYAEAEKAASTRIAYQTRLAPRHFAIWYLSRGAQALPAHQGLVAAYLSHLADTGLKASSIGRRVAAIADRHRAAGTDPRPPPRWRRAVIKGIRRTIGAAPVKKHAATADIVMQHARPMRRQPDRQA